MRNRVTRHIRFRSVLLGCSASAALLFTVAVPVEALAQQTPSSDSLAEVTVTATRVKRDGYEAPTPTTVLNDADIAAAAAPNIAQFVNEIPSLAGSATPTTQVGYVSNGTNGINALNLRNLGENRTLILLDGQRVGPSTTTGWVDINDFPQALVKRVDVVTGGASADWGSDAVAGVVNFVLDKDFTGLKGEASGGLTTYGDDGNYNLSVAAGAPFAGGRGHILLSLEDAQDNGVRDLPRSWYNGSKIIENPTYTPANGQPQLLVLPNVGFATATPGGIIASGPLAGTYFGPGGTPHQLVKGPITSALFMQGGQWPYTDDQTVQDLAPSASRQNAFLRTSFDITDHVEVFGQISFGLADSREHVATNLWPSDFGLTVQPDNAFIPSSIAGQVTGPFSFGTQNLELGEITVSTRRTSWRPVVGANGDFDFLGSNWTWDAYAQGTYNDVAVKGANMMNVGNWFNAIDAVRNPATGAIVCRSTLTNPTNGCVPFNLFGVGVNSQAALQYVEGTTKGRTQIQEVAEGGTLRGNPFDDWAGPISVAAGIEHRRESVGGIGDPLAGDWYEGNYRATHGAYDVTEGFFETVVPLVKDIPFAKSLDFNGAVRETSYSLSGQVTTYKTGGTWSPIDDLTFRVTRSHDIRAPDLSELFSAGQASTVSYTDPAHGNTSSLAFQVTNGNRDLKPEVSDSTEVGLVLRPRFLPGLQASADYYHLNITQAIATLGGQQIVSQCFAGYSSFCPLITRNGAGIITSVAVQPLNFASQVASGLDFEVSYKRDLATIEPSLDGSLSLHLLATRYLNDTYNNGVSPPINYVGGAQQDGFGDLSLPRWRYLATVGWNNESFSTQLTVRGVSDGLLDTTYISCASNCPAQTSTQAANNRTISNNHVPGAIYFDTNFTYKLATETNTSLFLNIKNILDTSPVQVPYGPGLDGAPQDDANPILYDTLGRSFRFGVRFKI